MKHRRVFQVLAVAMGVLLVESIGTASATTLTSPKGTTYTSTISLASEGSTTFTSSFFVTMHCNASSINGKIEGHGAGKNASGKLSSWSMTSCTDEITIKKPGSLAINSDGTVYSTGWEMITHTSVGECIYTTNNTDIGDVTDSHDTGGKATLDIPSKNIPVTGGSFFCPSGAIWEGSYVVNTPSTLYLD